MRLLSHERAKYDQALVELAGALDDVAGAGHEVEAGHRCVGWGQYGAHVDVVVWVGLGGGDLVGIGGVVAAGNDNLVAGLELAQVIKNAVALPAGDVAVDEHRAQCARPAALVVPAGIKDIGGGGDGAGLVEAKADNARLADINGRDRDEFGLGRGNRIRIDLVDGRLNR